MCTKTRKLSEEVEFWAYLASRFTEPMTSEQKKSYRDYIEHGIDDFKEFFESYLKKLIIDIEKGIVDTDITMDQGDTFRGLIDCEEIDAELRSRISTLVYGADERN